MAQFDVCQNNNPRTRKTVPYLLVIQADILDNLVTQAVAPLFSETKFGHPVNILNPVFEIENKKYVLSTAELAGIPKKSLGKKVCSLQEHRHEIIAALDLLFTGV